MIDLVICGIRGRMGSALVQLAGDRPDMRVVGGIDQDAGELDGGLEVVTVAQCAGLISGADVVIDFSSAAATRALLDHAHEALAGRALVAGTTGLAPATQQRLDDLSGSAAVLTAANFSLGVNLLLGLCERVSAALGPDAYDIEITEAHHGRKVDAPSGTALALAEAAARGRGRVLEEVRRDGRSGQVGERPAGEIGLHAIRGGSIVGEHSVMFIGQRERIELRHDALDRAVFADGALAAAAWIAGRAPGRYSMRDVLDLQRE